MRFQVVREIKRTSDYIKLRGIAGGKLKGELLFVNVYQKHTLSATLRLFAKENDKEPSFATNLRRLSNLQMAGSKAWISDGLGELLNYTRSIQAFAMALDFLKDPYPPRLSTQVEWSETGLAFLGRFHTSIDLETIAICTRVRLNTPTQDRTNFVDTLDEIISDQEDDGCDWVNPYVCT